VLDETRHLYYTQPSQWQVVEERVEDDADPERQFVWGHRYIDDLILRDRDTNGDGSLNERLFGLQDANWNLTTLIDTSGDVQERYAYSAYGTPKFLTPAFGSRASSSFDWETLYAGYRWETATRLFHVRHRVLNSALGTWCQRDDIRLASASNLYVYCDGQPTLHTDPTGQFLPLLALGVLGGSKTAIIVGSGLTIAGIVALGYLVGTACIEAIRRIPQAAAVDPCWDDYHACLLSTLSSLHNRCWDCYLACRGLGQWRGTMNKLDCAYWKHPSQG
jgi:RHS repeat-associated protein